jgi:hypothetical protein
MEPLFTKTEAMVELVTSFAIPWFRPQINVAIGDRQYSELASSSAFSVDAGTPTLVVVSYDMRACETSIIVTVAAGEICRLLYRVGWFRSRGATLTYLLPTARARRARP